MQAFHWVNSSVAAGSVPVSAVKGGVDVGGANIYVGRARFINDILPAKIIPAKNAAYVSHNGEEHQVRQYQVLCYKMSEWVHCHGGHVPRGAVRGGRTSNGEILFIGRVSHRGTKTVGKVHPSHKMCYIAFDGRELGFPEYEVLVFH